MKILSQLGARRAGLLLLALVAVALRPAAGTPAYEGWAMVPTLLVPVLAPLISFGIALDALMSRVMMTDAAAAERDRYRVVLWADFAALALLAVAWVPFFLALGR